MRKIALFIFIVIHTIANAQKPLTDNNLKGKLIRYENFPSVLVEPRNVDVWLPTDYDASGKTKYAVLYVHDGQNQFLPGFSFGGKEWRLDETMDSLMRFGLIRKTIVVAIWNTRERFIEYNPEGAYKQLDSTTRSRLDLERPGGSKADRYLDFIFTELKPFIDSNYRTLEGVKNTFMMGSSMGGLISLYALCNKSELIYGAACLSTHWSVSLKESYYPLVNSYVTYFGNRLPNPKQHKLYFDHGTKGLDAWYAPPQEQMDSICAESGYNSKSLLSIVFDGADHNEEAWQARVAIPLLFLLKPLK